MLLKICGFRTEEEIKAVEDLRLDFIGLNFIEGARPQIQPDQALSLKPHIKNMNVKLVGLFKDQPLSTVHNIAEEMGLDFIQLNGLEDYTYSKELRQPIMRTIAVNPTVSLDDIYNYIDRDPAEIYILDRFNQGEGVPVDPELAQSVINKYPGQVLLAGGISAASIPDLLSKVQPYGIDISGSVRTGGYIDPHKVQEIISLIN